MSKRIALILLVLWVGGMWVTGLSAYTLFQHFSDRMMAGRIAGYLFTNIAYIGMVAGFYLLIHSAYTQGTQVLKQLDFWLVLMMLLLVLAGHFGIQPLLAQLKADALPKNVMDSVFASRFSTWHGIASVAYLIQGILGVWLLFQSRYMR